MVSAESVPDFVQFAAAVDQLRSANATIGILAGSQHPDLTFAWKQLPSALAAFAMPPETRGAILFDVSRTIQEPDNNSEPADSGSHHSNCDGQSGNGDPD